MWQLLIEKIETPQGGQKAQYRERQLLLPPPAVTVVLGQRCLSSSRLILLKLRSQLPWAWLLPRKETWEFPAGLWFRRAGGTLSPTVFGVLGILFFPTPHISRCVLWKLWSELSRPFTIFLFGNWNRLSGPCLSASLQVWRNRWSGNRTSQLGGRATLYSAKHTWDELVV